MTYVGDLLLLSPKHHQNLSPSSLKLFTEVRIFLIIEQMGQLFFTIVSYLFYLHQPFTIDLKKVIQDQTLCRHLGTNSS